MLTPMIPSSFKTMHLLRCAWILIFMVTKISAQDMCWSLGNEALTSGTMIDPFQNFYLDVHNEARCSGLLESVQYCYYTPGGGRNQAFVGLYRPTTNPNTNVTTYSAVADVLMTLREDISFNDNGGFACGIVAVSPSISVSPGDVFGVCLDHQNENNNLPVVGSVSNVESMLFATGQPCDEMSTEVVSNMLTAVNNRRLHVNGNFHLSTESSTQLSTNTVDLVVSISGSLSTPISGSSSTPNVGSASNAVGLGVGLSITFLVVLIIVAATLVGLIFFISRRRKTNSKNFNAFSTDNSAINNCVYDEIGGNLGFISKNYEAPISSSSHTMTKLEEPALYEDIAEDNMTNGNAYSTPDDVAGAAPSQVIVDTISTRNTNSMTVKTRAQTTRLLQKSDLISESEEIIYEAPEAHESGLYAQIERHDTTTIDYSELEFISHLGSGNFGTVAKGKWKRQERVIVVAMKTLTEGDEEGKIKFLQEAVIMSQFKHPNVLLLHGICNYKDAVIIVMEFADKGDLREHLLTIKNESSVEARKLPKRLLSYSQHIALGMQYLSGKGFVHRDLAARNIFVTKDNTCKVADFGMSRDLFDENYYVSSGGKVPLKWTAPEAINFRKYSTAGDVWSYGCVLYEIWSLGTKPYSSMQNTEVLRFVNSGKRLSPPPGCPRMIYQQMMLCWHPEAGSRPTFQDIIMTLVGSDLLVLQVPPEIGEENPEAAKIGAPIEVGLQMYQDLCSQYCT